MFFLPFFDKSFNQACFLIKVFKNGFSGSCFCVDYKIAGIFIYDRIFVTKDWRWRSIKRKISEVWQLIDLMLLPMYTTLLLYRSCVRLPSLVWGVLKRKFKGRGLKSHVRLTLLLEPKNLSYVSHSSASHFVINLTKWFKQQKKTKCWN